MKYGVLGGLLTVSQWPAYRRFRQATLQPEQAQEAVLMTILEAGRDSVYGKRWDFGSIRSAREYQSRVPIVTYDDLADHIERMKRGETGILTSEKVVMFEPTGGASAASKYIPYTRRLKSEFNRAASAWIHDLYRHRPALRKGPGYWSISPAGREREVTSGGIPVGFELDTEYLGGILERLLGQMLVVPPAIGRVSDPGAHRYVTLRNLIGRRDLRLISVWNPTFLTLLVEALGTTADRLIDDVRRGTLTPPTGLPADVHAALAAPLRPDPSRADELVAIVREQGRLAPHRLWPELALISCWTSASSRLFLPAIETEFPGVEIQGKGLLATEGFVSFPLCGYAGSALALDSHFFELLPCEGAGGRARLAHEVEIGGRYTVLLTTGGGLYRYALGDEVEVIDLFEDCPLIRFVGRRGNVSDLCGEKLVDSFVDEVLGRVLGRAGVTAQFSMLAPEAGSPPRYLLFLEAPPIGASAPAILEDLDRELGRNPQYGYCRRLGQLGAPEVVLVERGVERYLASCQERGQRAGSVKPAALRKEMDWRGCLT